ncbi:MAG TPA: GTPase HflX [Chitinispirillaceae bacterium]|nr:GTPase HflX [Chitinispirillaceae bacterium]
MIENRKQKENVVLAGLLTSDSDPKLFEEDIQEMQMLCETADANVVACICQKRDTPVISTYLGYGKLHEIRNVMKQLDAETLVIDAQLSPGQIRNIEKIVSGKVIDRGQLILDIFAMHARTNEARIQVELAQMRTLYPRLTHAWTHFSQQVGGIGTRGPGEKQLEVDRRLVQKKISDLKHKLHKIEKGRIVQSKGRSRVFRASLVGYTNVGKSSLLNALSGSELLVENKLFATLDTATRKTYIPGAGSIVISDTVGFLRKLPHHLVASFRSTLGVVSDSHLLIVVMDASSAWIEQQMSTVNTVLKDLGAGDVQKIFVFNKIDLVKDPFVRKRLTIAYPEGIFISAKNKEDIAVLREHIAHAVINFEKEKQIADIIVRKTRSLVHEDR